MEFYVYTTNLSRDDFFQKLQKQVTLQKEFRLISYLSDGGAVVRGISPPDNCQTSFFGFVDKKSFQIVEHTQKQFISPYQPILYGQFEDNTIRILPKMHQQSYPLLSLYSAFGGLLIFLGILKLEEDMFLFITTTLFGLLLWFFPRFRTKKHFAIGVHRAISVFESLPLELQRIES